MAEHEDDIEKLTKQTQELINSAGIDMATLILNLLQNSHTLLPPNSEGKRELREAILLIDAFIKSGFVSIVAKPRAERENDRVKHYPGQHKGVLVSYITTNHDMGNFNLYGGLRDATGSIEMRDSKEAMQVSKHHASRTDSIASQPTHINFHIKDINQQPLVEVWFVHSLNRGFSLHTLKLHKERVDVLAIIGIKHPNYKTFKTRFSRASDTLTSLVPSSV